MKSLILSFLSFLISFHVCAQTLGNDRLVLIKAVDQQKKTFIINQGAHDNIHLRQESLFSSEDISFRARAIEVARHNSLWELTDRRGAVPFEQDEAVVFSHNIKDVFHSVTRAQALEETIQVRSEIEWTKREYFNVRASLSFGLKESITDTPGDMNANRGGQQFEVLYNVPLIGPLDIGFGFRADFERLIQDDPSLEIPTTRYLGVAEISYRLPSFQNGDFFYVAAAAGYGTSQTTVSGETNSGDVMVLPIAKVGYAKMVGRNRAFIVELVGESLSAIEKTPQDVEQKSTIVNGKISVGLRF